MKKITLSLVALALIFNSCENKKEEVAEDATTITKAEDREDTGNDQDMMVKSTGEAFLKEMEVKKGVTKTESGLMYELITEGEGDQPVASNTVKVHYKGMFTDGKEFDSSLGGDPIEFGLGQVIAGWTEGLQLMNRGAKYKFYIPYNLAYGEQGYPGAIPAYSALIFEVELLDFK